MKEIIEKLIEKYNVQVMLGRHDGNPLSLEDIKIQEYILNEIVTDLQNLNTSFEAQSLPIESDTTNKVSVSEEDAIKFAEWITKNDFELLTRGWVSSLLGYSSTFFTTTELYSIYKSLNG